MSGRDKMPFACALFAISNVILHGSALATDTGDIIFDLKPKSCVTISKGKECYGELTLSWQLDKPRNVCLFSETKDRPLFCWSKRLQGAYTASFKLSASTQYSLVDVESKEILLTDTISVTWVFQESRKRRRWRLF